ncbi:hypothetical protein VP01_210g5 [Puccinia sorghi]|uniref:Uncharacterized protein n=1 Tax=Puccinia sorghi TaxID=27349 RepID=A0A0L6VA01_9BASI|nr:hypothetical protein VP01_210g5 [Puccinia sorghi]
MYTRGDMTEYRDKGIPKGREYVKRIGERSGMRRSVHGKLLDDRKGKGGGQGLGEHGKTHISPHSSAATVRPGLKGCGRTAGFEINELDYSEQHHVSLIITEMAGVTLRSLRNLICCDLFFAPQAYGFILVLPMMDNSYLQCSISVFYYHDHFLSSCKRKERGDQFAEERSCGELTKSLQTHIWMPSTQTPPPTQNHTRIKKPHNKTRFSFLSLRVCFLFRKEIRMAKVKEMMEKRVSLWACKSFLQQLENMGVSPSFSGVLTCMSSNLGTKVGLRTAKFTHNIIFCFFVVICFIVNWIHTLWRSIPHLAPKTLECLFFSFASVALSVTLLWAQNEFSYSAPSESFIIIQLALIFSVQNLERTFPGMNFVGHAWCFLCYTDMEDLIHCQNRTSGFLNRFPGPLRWKHSSTFCSAYVRIFPLLEPSPLTSLSRLIKLLAESLRIVVSLTPMDDGMNGFLETGRLSERLLHCRSIDSYGPVSPSLSSPSALSLMECFIFCTHHLFITLTKTGAYSLECVSIMKKKACHNNKKRASDSAPSSLAEKDSSLSASPSPQQERLTELIVAQAWASSSSIPSPISGWLNRLSYHIPLPLPLALLHPTSHTTHPQDSPLPPCLPSWQGDLLRNPLDWLYQLQSFPLSTFSPAHVFVFGTVQPYIRVTDSNA